MPRAFDGRRRMPFPWVTAVVLLTSLKVASANFPASGAKVNIGVVITVLPVGGALPSNLSVYCYGYSLSQTGTSYDCLGSAKTTHSANNGSAIFMLLGFQSMQPQGVNFGITNSPGSERFRLVNSQDAQAGQFNMTLLYPASAAGNNTSDFAGIINVTDPSNGVISGATPDCYLGDPSLAGQGTFTYKEYAPGSIYLFLHPAVSMDKVPVVCSVSKGGVTTSVTVPSGTQTQTMTHGQVADWHFTFSATDQSNMTSLQSNKSAAQASGKLTFRDSNGPTTVDAARCSILNLSDQHDLLLQPDYSFNVMYSLLNLTSNAASRALLISCTATKSGVTSPAQVFTLPNGATAASNPTVITVGSGGGSAPSKLTAVVAIKNAPAGLDPKTGLAFFYSTTRSGIGTMLAASFQYADASGNLIYQLTPPSNVPLGGLYVTCQLKSPSVADVEQFMPGSTSLPVFNINVPPPPTSGGSGSTSPAGTMKTFTVQGTMTTYKSNSPVAATSVCDVQSNSPNNPYGATWSATTARGPSSSSPYVSFTMTLQMDAKSFDSVTKTNGTYVTIECYTSLNGAIRSTYPAVTPGNVNQPFNLRFDF